MTKNQVKSLVARAIVTLLARDGDLLIRNASEPAICGRLAGYLAKSFPTYDVDVEYDRHGFDRKMLDLPEVCRGGGRRKVIPDIVVHQRGNDRFNLVAIEVKKQTNRESRECDRAKLKAMRTQLRYRVAVFIDLPAGSGAVDRKPRTEWY